MVITTAGGRPFHPRNLASAWLYLLTLCAADMDGPCVMIPPWALRYERERPGKEHWQAPSETERRAAGDCEDLVRYSFRWGLQNGGLLLPALARFGSGNSVVHAVNLCVILPDGIEPSHIVSHYPLIYPSGRWPVYDPSYFSGMAMPVGPQFPRMPGAMCGDGQMRWRGGYG